jgi:hypothetical protein
MLISVLSYKLLVIKSNKVGYINYIKIKLGLNALLYIIKKTSYNKMKCIWNFLKVINTHLDFNYFYGEIY